ncbi:MAG: phosphoribosylanthranilate isomerase [Verrucomicrobiales bacterium]|nr:phosphoribosylanthranilate isomerase [Verrucomicrobiales bacterium]
MSVRVKICGVTRLEDAQAAVAAGADALGFMFYERSARRVSVGAAAAICRQLPPFVSKVGVFVDAGIETIEETVAQCGLDVVQLHGAESPAFCGRLTRPVIKAVRVRGPETLAELEGYATAAWLLDAYVPGQPGGTGATFDWGLATQAVAVGRPVILAGGLTTANVAAAVRQVRPYAVDVSSGVESEPGRKDAAALRAFVEAAKSS